VESAVVAPVESPVASPVESPFEAPVESPVESPVVAPSPTAKAPPTGKGKSNLSAQPVFDSRGSSRYGHGSSGSHNGQSSGNGQYGFNNGHGSTTAIVMVAVPVMVLVEFRMPMVSMVELTGLVNSKFVSGFCCVKANDWYFQCVPTPTRNPKPTFLIILEVVHLVTAVTTVPLIMVTVPVMVMVEFSLPMVNVVELIGLVQLSVYLDILVWRAPIVLPMCSCSNSCC
jgi:hypothetical protein